MSVVTDITFEGKPHRSLFSSRDLVPHRKELDQAAKKAGVPSLFSFSHSVGEETVWARRALGEPDTAAMDEDEREEYEDRLPQATFRTGEWYDPNDGLRTVEGLLACFEKHPSGAGDPARPIVPELKELRKLLLKAKGTKQRFRLSVGA